VRHLGTPEIQKWLYWSFKLKTNMPMLSKKQFKMKEDGGLVIKIFIIKIKQKNQFNNNLGLIFSVFTIKI
jgi:hypothetical protein